MKIGREIIQDIFMRRRCSNGNQKF